MRIDRKLNLVLEVEGDNETTLYVHHTPIRQEVFEQHFMFITKAMTSMYVEGLHPVACTRIAYYTMNKLAMAEGPEQHAFIDNTLFNEIWRLTNVLVPGERGWELVPFFQLMKGEDNTLSPSDIMEVKNYICFFTGGSWVHGRKERENMYEMLTASGLQTTSSDVTVYKNSLLTLKPGANTGETEKPSSIPS
jgi:hypothetical protein